MENWAVLSGRLRDLEARGVIERHVMPTSPPSVEYQLTSLGRELLPAIMSLWKSDHGCCSVTLWANGEAATTEANRFISVRHSRRSARLGVTRVNSVTPGGLLVLAAASNEDGL